MSEEERTARMARWQGAITYNALDEADLIIEAVFEDMDVKLAVFAELDRVAGAVLATNTSHLDINRIARATRGPADVLGLHFAGQHHEAAGGGGGPVDLARHRGHRFRTGAATGQDARASRRLRRLHRQPHPGRAPAGGRPDDAGRRLALRDRRGRARLRLSHGPVPDGRPGWRRHRLGHAQAPRRHARPGAALRAHSRPALRARLVRPEERAWLLPVSGRRAPGRARSRGAGPDRRGTPPRRRLAPHSARTRFSAATWPP